MAVGLLFFFRRICISCGFTSSDTDCKKLWEKNWFYLRKTGADLENAKIMGWVSKMCLSDTTPFFSCPVTGMHVWLVHVSHSFVHFYKYYNSFPPYFWPIHSWMPWINCRECPLQLPPQQLESALNKYASLRGSLAAYARQPSIRTSLPRYSSLGLVHHSFCDILLVMIVEGVSSQHSDFIGVRIKTWIRIWTRMRLWDLEITKIIFLNNLVVSTWIFSEQTIKFNETYCQICIMKSSYGGYIFMELIDAETLSWP